MHCKKCGNRILEDEKMWRSCKRDGNEINLSMPEENISSNRDCGIAGSNNSKSQDICEELTFSGEYLFLRTYTLMKVNTTVQVYSAFMKIRQSIKMFFAKEHIDEKKIGFSEIQSVESCTIITLGNLIFGIEFILLSLYGFYLGNVDELVLLCVVLFLCIMFSDTYKKEIKITLINGNVLDIPLGKKDKVEKIFTYIGSNKIVMNGKIGFKWEKQDGIIIAFGVFLALLCSYGFSL